MLLAQGLATGPSRAGRRALLGASKAASKRGGLGYSHLQAGRQGAGTVALAGHAGKEVKGWDQEDSKEQRLRDKGREKLAETDRQRGVQRQ